MPISSYQMMHLEYESGYEAGFKAGFAKAIESAHEKIGGRITPVGVCFCGECKHMMPDGHCDTFADSKICPSVSDFCSYGERKTYRCTQCDDEIPYEGICDKCRKLRGEL